MTRWERKILQIVRKVNPNNPIQYVHHIVKEDARKKLDQQLATCQTCKISSSSRTLTYGSTDAHILVLTNAVLPEQNIKKQITYPLIGSKAWDLIVTTFQFYQIDISSCFFMNTVNCCPYLTLEQDILYRIPNLQEKESCKPYLDRAIEIIKPKFMIILGNVALNSLIKANVDSIHGHLLDINGIPSIATFGPDYLLKCQEQDPDMYECEKNIFFKDFEKISEEIHLIDKKEHI